MLTADPLQAMYLMLVLLGAGAVLPTLGWLLALDAVCVAALAAAGVPRADQYAWQHVAVALLFAGAVAHLLQRMRAQGHRRLDQLTAALAAQASRDDLTGLLNRRGLHAAAEQARRADPRPAAGGHGAAAGAVYLDVDGFKRINDELGHSAGDVVLVEVADRLRQLAGPHGLVARVGGDEFAVVLFGLSADQGAERVARLGHRARTRLTGTAGVLQLPWTVSVGTALAHGCGASDDERLARLLQAADLAMYQDKRSRRAAPLQHR